MKSFSRKIVASLLALGLLLAPSVSMAQPYYFWWQAVDELGRALPSQTVSCSVYDLASHGAKVMYLAPSLAPHNGVMTSMPLLGDASSKFHFYSDVNTDVRVVCYYARGGAATDMRIGRSGGHQVMIDRQGRKVVRFPFVNNAARQNTGIVIPAGSIIRDIIVQNTALVQDPPLDDTATPHLNVGFAGNHAISINHSLIDRMHLARQPEWIRPGSNSGTGRSILKTGGAGTAYHFGALEGFGAHRGIALAVTCRGAVSGPALGSGCGYVETAYMVHVAGGLELTYQTSSSPTVPISGHVFVIYESYHTGVSTQPVQ